MNTQEAYMTGFCKTAEAYGIDPIQLMKVAAEGKDYRPPASVLDFQSDTEPGMRDIPMFDPQKNMTKDYFHTYGEPEEAVQTRWGYLDDMNRAISRGSNDDILTRIGLATDLGMYGKDWYPAHTNALNFAIQPLQKINQKSEEFFQKHPGDVDSNPYLKMLNEDMPQEEYGAYAKRYHDSMLSQTGTPQRVSSPLAR